MRRLPRRRLQVRAEAWPLARPFTISRGTKTTAEVVVVDIEQDGLHGRGECVPYPRHGETTAEVDTGGPRVGQPAAALVEGDALGKVRQRAPGQDAHVRAVGSWHITYIGLDLIGQSSDLGVRLRASDRSAQQAAATGWFC